MESTDPTVRAFYTGFCLARNGQKELFEQLKRIDQIKRELRDIDKRIHSFKREYNAP